MDTRSEREASFLVEERSLLGTANPIDTTRMFTASDEEPMEESYQMKADNTIGLGTSEPDYSLPHQHGPLRA